MLEERQISRMILEVERLRAEAALLEKENATQRALVAKLDEQIATLKRLAEAHKQAAADREKALQIKDRIESLYKQSLDEANKKIARLTRANRRLKKAALVGALASFLFGLVVAR